MDEFELIKRYFSDAGLAKGVDLGVGDDCALVSVPDGHQLAMSIDTLLPDVHFFADAAPELIAQRALAVAISDLAAMGAAPLCFTLALTLPKADSRWLQGFSEGLMLAADRYCCPLVGGDTVRGPLTISIQVQGTLPAGMALTRAGAGVGDLICVSGELGDGAAALAALKGELKLDDTALAHLKDHFYRPRARLDIGLSLRGLATAAIDISDGLLADLGHICQNSGLGAELNPASLPVSKLLRSLVGPEQWQRWALSGGDDYQLCFTVTGEREAELWQLVEREQLDITAVGRMISGQGIRGIGGIPLNFSGYRHF